MAGEEQHDISMSPVPSPSSGNPVRASATSAMPNPNQVNPIEESRVSPQMLGHDEITEAVAKNVYSADVIDASVEQKGLELAEELTGKANEALKEKDYAESVDCFSQALEIRVSHFGELAPECLNAYYLYGQSLLRKAQEEADPIGVVPKKEGKSGNETGETSSDDPSSHHEEEKNNNPKSEGAEEDESEDDEEATEQEEDETDLDMAWKMLDIARAISQKQEGDTMEKVEILSLLAEAALEREDIVSSLTDYRKALSILEKIVEPDSRHVAELHFRICLCHEIGYQFSEAIPHCQKALDVCRARIQRLGSAPSEDPEVETLCGLSDELEKKLEDLQQLNANPRAMLAELFASVKENATLALAGKSDDVAGRSDDGAGWSDDVAGRSGVKDLGVVGRGVKRVVMGSSSEGGNPAKKPEV